MASPLRYSARPREVRLSARAVAIVVVLVAGMAGFWSQSYSVRDALGAEQRAVPGAAVQPVGQARLVVRGVVPVFAFDGKAAPKVTPPVAVTNPEAGVVVDDRADRIRAYYGSYGTLPLAGVADDMVAEADRAGIDWRLMPVIGMLESTGGLHSCGGNAFGWGSCTLRSFDTFAEAITVVADTLAAPPYAGLAPPDVFCMWVAGGKSWCSTYVAAAMTEIGKLGAP